MFQMFPSKAPGPDGFPTLFFQKYWDIINVKLVAFCLRILNGGASDQELNHTNIALIPKVKNPVSAQNFRPISLCNIAYKIIAKALTNRLKCALHDLIFEFQGAFVPGRLISDNIIVGYECIEHIMKKRQGRKGCVALKIDMSKAYDRVEWIFWSVLWSRWVGMIMNCVSSFTFYVLINGVAKGVIQPQRGLRQRDPLSPYLFLLCAESLSSLLSNALNKNLITWCKVARSSPSLSHLFFVDDSLLFCKDSMEEW